MLINEFEQTNRALNKQLSQEKDASKAVREMVQAIKRELAACKKESDAARA